VTILADERVKLTNQAVTGARLMKISGWEGPLTDAIRNAREREVGAMQKATFLRACNEALFFIQPTVLSLLTFTTYVATGNELTPAKVFTTIALLNLTQFSVGKFLFLSVQGCSEAWVSIKRLEKLFLLDENDGFSFIGDDPDVFGEEEDALPNPAPMLGSEPSSMSRISLTNSSFRWTSQAQLSTKEVEAEGENEDSDSEDSNDKHEAGRGNGATLQDIQLEVMDGELVGVAGPVAAAKSSLLLAVLREMVPESDSTGHHHVLGRIAYASQEPWIQGGRLRDNILFGQKFDKQRYWRVVNACALGPDLESLPYGDSTIIGDRGVNLSGGQKARVGLARLAYADADVYLLDDPLSAVDPGVGKHLFHSVICGLLKGKTRVLVTHQTQYLQDVDRVIIMRGGRITAQGKWDELSAAGSLAGVIAVSAMETLPGVDDLATQELTEALPQRENGMGEHGEKETADNDGPRSRASTILSAPETGAEILNRGKSVEAQVEEQQQSGNVSLSTYRQYVNAAAGPALGIVMVVLLVAGQALTMLVFLLLAKWSQAADYKDAWWMWSFILVCLLAIIMSFLRATVTFHSLLRSSKQLHNRMLERVVRAPVSFFDLNSSGIILNRFAKDIAYMDDMLPMTVYDFITCLFMVLGTIILVVVVNFWVVLALVPSIFIFYYLLKFYLKTSREVKRLEAKTRSPLYTFLSESLDGLVTIRAFGAQKRFLEEFSARLDLNTRAFYAFIFTARWLGFRLDVIVILILSAACFISVALNEFASDKVNAGLLGVALVYVIQLGGLFQWAVRQAAEVENQIVSVERVLQYCELEQEAALYSKPGKEPPENWPDKGSIEVEDLWASYRPGLPPVLKGLTFNISPGTVVGIVGRTGAGKSSLVSTLFRLLEYDASKGFIAIDGIKTCEVGLHELRPRLSVIPQTPFLFSGTFRQNLDPFLKRSDAQIWAALEAVQLSAYIAAQPGGLSTLMTENGGNLSSGQRQLVCLARAILQRSTVLVLDEATANIDVQTDQLISSAIRANFKGCTVIM
jgi:ATP-binding cassette subfamily C (CFTR/MRP) protein 4